MRKIISMFLAVLLLVALTITAFAESITDLTLTLVDDETPVPGVTFEIYRVGRYTAEGTAELTGRFADYPVTINQVSEDSSAEANALFAFAKKDALTPEGVATTGPDGAAVLKDLPEGVYLIGGLPCEFGDVVYLTEPQLLVLPHVDAGTEEVDLNPVLQVKFSRETELTISRKVLKVWLDGSGNARPQSVVVHLLENGAVFDTVTLTAENQWRNVWENLDATSLWQIVEEVPQPYTVQVELEGSTFLVKNTAPDTPPTESTVPTEPTEPGDDIPQTGMLWWPVLVLAGLGVAMVTGGVALRKGSRHDA